MSRRALVSVYDKTGIENLGRSLVDLGFELVSTGGTAATLEQAGLPVTQVEQITELPEMLGDRVKTLHPKIHGGLLAVLDNEDHQHDLDHFGIEPFELMIGNLYPFHSNPSIDLIDIGGPAMVRGAAKNYAYVGVVVDPSDYQLVLDELEQFGTLSAETRLRLARKAFAHTAAYDAAITTWFDEQIGSPDLPPTIHLALELAEPTRYGENPHQKGARYRMTGHEGWWDKVEQHQGLAMSYLNFYDADAGWQLVHDFQERFGDWPTVAIIKHANPCGFARADDLDTAYELAYECDSDSAFGGIVVLNQPVDLATAQRMAGAAQADVVIAPGYEDGVLGILEKRRKNTRVLSAPAPASEKFHLRQLSGGSWLVQDAHHFASVRSEWRVVTDRQPTVFEMDDAELAFRLGGWVKSNSIVLVKDGVAWGIGAGQQNRLESARIATAKANGRAAGGACGSDAFFPFPDGVEAAAESGVAVVIQPGGAQRDAEIIERANELGLAMIFTNERHFLH